MRRVQKRHHNSCLAGTGLALRQENSNLLDVIILSLAVLLR
jgi:hypothetical protein